MMDIKEVLLQLVYELFDKKISGTGIRYENISNKELAEESKIQEKKCTITFYRQYLGCWSCWYVINK